MMGQRVRVILDRIDRQQRRLQFALIPTNSPATKAHSSPTRTGKPKKAGKSKVSPKAKAKKKSKRR